MTDRYTILGKIADGGMARVYLGRMAGTAGFSRLVAIKRLHPELATDKDFVAMLLDEARLTAQIRHTNVVDTLDLIATDGVFSLVLEYVEGDALSSLTRHARAEGEPVPRPIVVALIAGLLRGLDAAHETRTEDGSPLGIVHRDVSPQNVLVGVDGVPRIIDFGIAKAMGRFFSTRPGEVRGKFSYMAPEQLLGHPVTRQVDVYAAGVLLWELLTGKRLFEADDERQVCAAVLRGKIPRPSTIAHDVPDDLDAIVLRATAHDLGARYLTAREFLQDLGAWPVAPDEEVGAWVKSLAAKHLAERQAIIKRTSRPLESAPVDDLIRDAQRGSSPSAHVGPLPAPSQPSTASDPSQRSFGSHPSQRSFGSHPSQRSFGSHPSQPSQDPFAPPPGLLSDPHPTVGNTSFSVGPSEAPPQRRRHRLVVAVLALVALATMLVAVVRARTVARREGSRGAATHAPAAVVDVASAATALATTPIAEASPPTATSEPEPTAPAAPAEAPAPAAKAATKAAPHRRSPTQRPQATTHVGRPSGEPAVDPRSVR